MRKLRKFLHSLEFLVDDSTFLHVIENIQNIVAKILSLVMIVVILVAVFDLIIFLGNMLFFSRTEFIEKQLFEIFGLFLNLLISIEILENITAYLKKHTLQVELVIVTSLIAVARKIIIFSFEKYSGTDLLGLGIAIFALSIGYWIIRQMNSKREA
ncbi:phosphate-starvation-inducible PsiE family protein [Oxynema sp. CENA135]|uniref:phosphate-starvation-inducible PsiE family protein n=1 Tax=Oxynema sp. CENA135 TaxID=984206 RepID=UPI00190A23D5|nr:phosphate-starvation-inducible PsiE family protein [Oxynema sp. CENA135]MBK4730246.1 phosphate-starvation-inducible PsiE family protein [Oxynema sp. CENA135]